MKYYYQTNEATEELLNSDQHGIMDALRYCEGSTTNSEVKRMGRLNKLSTQRIGYLLASLRARHLLKYIHVDSGSLTGHGRYQYELTSKYIGEICE